MTKKIKETKKNENIKKILEDEKKKSKVYLNQYKYLKADFENYRKMMEKDKLNVVQYANQKLILELLTVIDDIENAINKTKNNEQIGLKIILDNLTKILESNGLKLIECIGKKFDPYCHEVLIKEKSNEEDEIIIEEIQKGYMFNNKVIRHSKVKISEKR